MHTLGREAPTEITHQPSGLQSKCYESDPCNARKFDRNSAEATEKKLPQNTKKHLKESALVFRHAAHLCWRWEKKGKR